MAKLSQRETLIYLAGLMDADGFFGIAADLYRMRKGLRPNPEWVERAGLKQVTPIGPDLLHATFGGYRGIEKPSAQKGQMLHVWKVTNAAASLCASRLLPFLQIKHGQASLVVLLAKHKAKSHCRPLKEAQVAYRQSLYAQIRRLNDVRGEGRNMLEIWDKPRLTKEPTPAPSR